MTESCCNECIAKERCPFYEKDAEECVYDAMMPREENKK